SGPISGGPQCPLEFGGAQDLFDRVVVVKEEMLRDQDHGESVDRPAAGRFVDLNVHLRLSHPQAPHTALSVMSQFCPISPSIRDAFQPLRSIAAVMFGHSPIVLMPSGLTMSPKFVRRRAYPLSRVIQSKNSLL